MYLDNAATSFPKPPEVVAAINRFLTEFGGNPGRSAHRLAIEAAREMLEARESIARLFNLSDPLRVVFCSNATEAINLALHGLLRPADHVITSTMEHNAVMRPLRVLGRRGVSVTAIRCSPEGLLDPDDVKRAIKPSTKLIVLNHASNVSGTILPIEQIGKLARERGLLFLVDAAQTAGVLPVDMKEACIDLLAFTGHKSLYGPPGTGGLVLGERVDPAELTPLKQGGTGSRSESEEQPLFLPDRFESGTLNACGIAGLRAGVQAVLSRGVEQIRRQELKLTELLLQKLSSIPGLTIYGPSSLGQRTAVCAFTLRGVPVERLAERLDKQYGILCRAGLHCAPQAHRTLGTFPHGTVRFSLGMFTTEEQIERAARAVSACASRT